MNQGVGSLNHLQKYVGVPYVLCGRDIQGLDCWGLVWLFHAVELGIYLPDWVTDADVDISRSNIEAKVVDEPFDGCLIRTPRTGGAPDHWGIYVAGSVLTAEFPKSALVPVNRYMESRPGSQFYEVGVTDA